MVPLDTVSTVYHSIYIHEQPRIVNDFKNIKSLHFDPSKLEPLKKTCLDQRSSQRLMHMLLFRRHFDISQEAMFSRRCESFVS